MDLDDYIIMEEDNEDEDNDASGKYSEEKPRNPLIPQNFRWIGFRKGHRELINA